MDQVGVYVDSSVEIGEQTNQLKINANRNLNRRTTSNVRLQSSVHIGSTVVGRHVRMSAARAYVDV